MADKDYTPSETAVAMFGRRTLAGPLAMNDRTPPAAATAQEQRQPATTAPREQNGERDAR